MRFDFSKQKYPTYGGHLRMGSEQAKKNGSHVFDLTNKYLTLDGKPFYMIAAEMQFSHFDCRSWEKELLKIKAAGVNTVAFYVFWNQQEEQEGIFNFDGDRDIRTFVTLCGKHGLFVWLRPGPWVHGESRYGGFPDWLMEKQLPIRTNDERYLYYADRLYAAYAEQLNGLFWCDGGPIIGMQLDNELTDNADHLAKLKEIALFHGMDVPYFSVTGWRGTGVAFFPKGEVLPTFGCYPDYPWDGSLEPIEGTTLALPVCGRSDSNIGSDLIHGDGPNETEDTLKDYPYLTCETGPGIQITHHRRPIIRPLDVYLNSMMTAAKGCNGISYYIFHGGRNPKGGLYHESRDSGYPNDVPVSSYDFQAPLSEYGFTRPSYNYFRLLHELIQSSDTFAESETYYSDAIITSRMDVTTPRAVLRCTNDGEGFLFISTHQRTLPLEPLSGFTAELDSGKGIMQFPRTPIDIPTDTVAAFPLNFTLGGQKFDYATAQPIGKIEVNGRTVHFYTALNGVRCEFAKTGGEVIQILPSRNKAFSVGSNDVFVLTFADALRFYRFGNRVWLTDRAMYMNGETVTEYGVWGNMNTLYFDSDTMQFVEIPSPAPAEKPDITLLRQEKCSYHENDNIYLKYLFSKPEECTEYKLNVPKNALDSCEDIRLRIKFHGDVGMIFCENELLADFYSTGEETIIGLSRFRDEIKAGKQLTLVLSPLKDKRIYFERYINRSITEAVITGTDVIQNQIR